MLRSSSQRFRYMLSQAPNILLGSTPLPSFSNVLMCQDPVLHVSSNSSNKVGKSLTRSFKPRAPEAVNPERPNKRATPKPPPVPLHPLNLNCRQVMLETCAERQTLNSRIPKAHRLLRFRVVRTLGLWTYNVSGFRFLSA